MFRIKSTIKFILVAQFAFFLFFLGAHAQSEEDSDINLEDIVAPTSSVSGDATSSNTTTVITRTIVRVVPRIEPRVLQSRDFLGSAKELIGIDHYRPQNLGIVESIIFIFGAMIANGFGIYLLKSSNI